MLKISPTKLRNDFVFLSFPRSGVNFIRTYFFQVSGVLFDRTHNHKQIQPGSKIIYVMRNPIDAITSAVAMELEFLNGSFLNIDNRVLGMIDDYIEISSWAINNANYIIDYDKMTKNPDHELKMLGEFTGIEISFKEYSDSMLLSQDKIYLVTSKASNYYEIAKNIINKININEANKIYQEILKMSNETLI